MTQVTGRGCVRPVLPFHFPRATPLQQGSLVKSCKLNSNSVNAPWEPNLQQGATPLESTYHFMENAEQSRHIVHRAIWSCWDEKMLFVPEIFLKIKYFKSLGKRNATFTFNSCSPLLRSSSGTNDFAGSGEPQLGEKALEPDCLDFFFFFNQFCHFVTVWA